VWVSCSAWSSHHQLCHLGFPLGSLWYLLSASVHNILGTHRLSKPVPEALVNTFPHTDAMIGNGIPRAPRHQAKQHKTAEDGSLVSCSKYENAANNETNNPSSSTTEQLAHIPQYTAELWINSHITCASRLETCRLLVCMCSLADSLCQSPV